MPTTLSGQLDLGSATEGTALAGNTDIASFTDNNLTDTASAFTATIDWGDGSTTTGTVVGSNGSFTVQGGHTYADEGFPQANVTVTRPADSSQLLLTGTVAVADSDAFSNVHGNTLTFTPNTPLTNVTVATFTDSNTANVAGDFTASIDWGDGTTTTGAVQGSNGSFSVVGSHTYAASGEFVVSVAFADDAPDAASGFVSGTAVSGFGGQVTLTSATEGTALNGAEVATFADTTGSHAATDYTASIDWGDGTTTSGTVIGSGQSFSVTGSHTYADEEGNEINGTSPLMKVTITRTADSMTIAPTATVAVADADFLSPVSQTVDGSPNTPLTTVVVAKFNDSYTGNVASEFTATIDWGDGSDPDTGTVSGSAGSFTVSGSHTYTTNGQYNINVGVLEDIPQQTQIGTIASTAIIGLVPGSGTSFGIPEGGPTGPIPVATFNDGNQSDTASDFTATIDWGDGSTTTGVVSGSNGSFTVSASAGHTYADEGSDTITTTVMRTADHSQVIVTGTATVSEADNLAISPDNISGNPGQPFTNVQVASFTTSFIGNVASDFSAVIDWGDGTTSPGSISGSSGNFIVTGTHTYASGGNDTFTVTVADDDPGTATITGSGTATINFAGQMVLTAATEATALPNNTPVATFSDSNGGDTPASFTATINWGDGTSSAGTVSGGGGTFTVSGGHTYADEGNDQASVTLTHTSDSATSTVSGGVAVAENDVLNVHATSFSAKAQQAFNGAVATFTDTDNANVAGDFIAVIDWGDGTTNAGSISGSNGAFTVNGSHTYAAAGPDNVTVTVTDDAPGTATATGTASIQVAPNMVVMTGTPGNDTFTALPGDERIDAGQGVDTINFNFRLVDATISWVGNEVIVDGPSGSHTQLAESFSRSGNQVTNGVMSDAPSGSHTVLTGFEVFNFTDGTVHDDDGNPLVDDLFYYSQYHDVWNAHVDADAHYNSLGWHEGRDPNAFFSTNLYLSANPDVRASGVNPLTQYDSIGWTQHRIPSLTFNGDSYLAANPDVAAAHVDPLWHFLIGGAGEGRQPIAPTEWLMPNGFDFVYYLQHNPDVAAAHIDPFQHFETQGWKEGRNPNAFFDTNGYLAAYTDVAAAHINPLDHYNTNGWHEGRDPSTGFDTTSYLSAYPDVAAAGVNPLVHFLGFGIHEGRQPFGDGVFDH